MEGRMYSHLEKILSYSLRVARTKHHSLGSLTTNISASHFWRLGNSRSRHWKRDVWWEPTSWLTEVIFLLCPHLKKWGCGGSFLGFLLENESESYSVMSDSLWPHGLYSPWNSPGQNTGVGSLSLLQGIFPTQGLNPGLPHCRRIFYQLSHKGSPLYCTKW